MKKLYALAAVPFLAFGVGYVAHWPTARVVKPAVTSVKTRTVASGPLFYTGDSQANGQQSATLEAVYSSRQTIGQMSAHPYQATVISFQLKTDIDQQDLQKQSLIYTSDNQYLKPTDGPYGDSRCDGDCLSFILPDGILADSFIYRDFIWQL